MNASAGRHHESEYDFLTSRTVPDRHLSCSEMAANVGRIDMPERHHETRAHSTNRLGRRHNRLGLAERLAHRPAPGFVPYRAVLEFAVFADNDPLAIRFDFASPAEDIDQTRGEIAPKRAQVLLESKKIRLVASREGIADDCQRRPDNERKSLARTSFVPNLFS